MDRCVDLAERDVRRDGRTVASASAEASLAICWRCASGRSGRGVKPVLLLGHLDTVWPLGTLKKMPFRVEKGGCGVRACWI